MAAVPMTHVLMVAGAIFGLGLVGVLVRRNIIFVLMSIVRTRLSALGRVSSIDSRPFSSSAPVT